jgi:hypothetical protein
MCESLRPLAAESVLADVQVLKKSQLDDGGDQRFHTNLSDGDGGGGDGDGDGRRLEARDIRT